MCEEKSFDESLKWSSERVAEGFNGGEGRVRERKRGIMKRV
jgi:hypothetical protein